VVSVRCIILQGDLIQVRFNTTPIRGQGFCILLHASPEIRLPEVRWKLSAPRVLLIPLIALPDGEGLESGFIAVYAYTIRIGIVPANALAAVIRNLCAFPGVEVIQPPCNEGRVPARCRYHGTGLKHPEFQIRVVPGNLPKGSLQGRDSFIVDPANRLIGFTGTKAPVVHERNRAYDRLVFLAVDRIAGTGADGETLPGEEAFPV